jgi:Tol biopolymer transport system component
VWLDARGKSEPVMDTRGGWAQPRVSPDGKRVLLRKVGTDCELWVYDIERASLARVAQGLDHHDAVWGPDGQRVAFRRANAPQAMMTISIGGARESAVLAGVPGIAEPQGWSAGGGRLVYTLPGRTTRGDIWVLPMDGGGPPAPFVATPADEAQPTISPDGDWIAYVSTETGTDEVLVRRYPDTGTAWQISAGGGTSPLWSRDGRELYFVSGQKMMAVPVQTRPAFRAGVPVERLAGGFNTSRARDFDVAPDGRFVAIARGTGEGSRQEIRMLLNWEQELKRLAGAGR